MSFRSRIILALLRRCARRLSETKWSSSETKCSLRRLSETLHMSLVIYITLFFYRSGGNGVVAREKLSDCGIGELRA